MLDSMLRTIHLLHYRRLLLKEVVTLLVLF
jgi:hypothetical protein